MACEREQRGYSPRGDARDIELEFMTDDTGRRSRGEAEDVPGSPNMNQDPVLWPLLRSEESQSPSRDSIDSSKSLHDPEDVQNGHPSRNVEDDVLPETAVVGRSISWTSAYILVISRVIGSGIFATPGAIVKSVGSMGLTLVLWIIGALVSACGLAVALEYGCMLPRSGGQKVYLEFTYRRPKFLASTLIAISAVLLGFSASNCIVFGKYTLFALDIEPTRLTQNLLAVGLLTVITIIHGTWLKLGIWIQNALGWVKVGLVIFMVLTGVYVVIFPPATGLATAQRSQLFDWEELWRGSEWHWSILATGLFKVFYSYAGLENLNNVMNEVKDPVRTLKSVSHAGLLTACVLYLLINVAYFLVVPIEDIKSSGELISALFFERTFGSTIGRRILPLAVAMSAAGNVMVVTFALARVNQEIARQGFLPFASTLASSRPFNTPLGGLIVHYIPSLLVITIPPSETVYSFILDVEGYPGQIFSLATSLGLIWLRFKRPDLHRPYKAWLLAVVFRISLSLALIAAPFLPMAGKSEFGGLYALVGISILVFGVIYWYVWTILIPKWKGYALDEEEETLKDGTTITKLVHVPKES